MFSPQPFRVRNLQFPAMPVQKIAADPQLFYTPDKIKEMLQRDPKVKAIWTKLSQEQQTEFLAQSSERINKSIFSGNNPLGRTAATAGGAATIGAGLGFLFGDGKGAMIGGFLGALVGFLAEITGVSTKYMYEPIMRAAATGHLKDFAKVAEEAQAKQAQEQQAQEQQAQDFAAQGTEAAVARAQDASELYPSAGEQVLMAEQQVRDADETVSTLPSASPAQEAYTPPPASEYQEPEMYSDAAPAGSPIYEMDQERDWLTAGDAAGRAAEAARSQVNAPLAAKLREDDLQVQAQNAAPFSEPVSAAQGEYAPPPASEYQEPEMYSDAAPVFIPEPLFDSKREQGLHQAMVDNRPYQEQREIKAMKEHERLAGVEQQRLFKEKADAEARHANIQARAKRARFEKSLEDVRRAHKVGPAERAALMFQERGAGPAAARSAVREGDRMFLQGVETARNLPQTAHRAAGRVADSVDQSAREVVQGTGEYAGDAGRAAAGAGRAAVGGVRDAADSVDQSTREVVQGTKDFKAEIDRKAYDKTLDIINRSKKWYDSAGDVNR